MEAIELLRQEVSIFDASLKSLASDDMETRMSAILDAALLLTAAKRVVLES